MQTNDTLNGTSQPESWASGPNGNSAGWGRLDELWIKGVGGPQETRKIAQSIAYMIKHLDHPLRVARLALLVNVSASHYFALFKRLTGRTPIDVFIRLRMSRACQLLDSTSMEVKEVAAALGYEDPFYFSRLFKSVNQVAPSEYRTLSNERRSCIRRATIPNSLSATADRESGVVDGRHSPQKP